MSNIENKFKCGVIVANYNSAKYFDECLDGLLGQTWLPNFIVISDDCSTDDSISTITSSLSKRFFNVKQNKDESTDFIKNNSPLIRLVQGKKNQGPAGARNLALAHLINSTNVIFINDIDDTYYPTKIEKSILIMHQYPEVGLVYSDYDIFDERTNELRREYKEPYSFNKLTDECIVSNNSAIATNLFKIVGPYDTKYRGPEDYDMWLRISEVSCVYHIPEALYKYRVSGNNITITTPSEKFAKQVFEVQQSALRRRYAKKQ